MSNISGLTFKPDGDIALFIIIAILMVIVAHLTFKSIQHIRLRRAIKKQFLDQSVDIDTLSEDELKKEIEVIKKYFDI